MPNRRRRLSALAVVLAVALVVPAPWLAGAPTARGQAGPAPGSPDAQGRLQPTIHYEDALNHAGDRIAFVPGERVKVPFRPRYDDDWSVGGRAPRPLPAARKSGKELVETGSAKRGEENEPPVAPDSVPVPDSPSALSLDRAVSVARAPERMLAARVAPGGLRREVFGFLPYWELQDSSTRLDYSVLSTVAYFGVGADKDGHLITKRSDGTTDTGWAGWTSNALTNVINAAHANGTRVVLTVQRFGWTASQSSASTALLSSETARQTLADEIAAAVRDRGADGVNLDFEPIPSGQGANYVTFVRQVRAALDVQAPGYQLTFDTTGWIGNYDVAALTAPGAADAVFIMGYDYRTSSSGTAASISPLTGPAYDLTDTVARYLERTSASQIILGVPYYGRAWSTTSDALHAPTRPGSSTYGYSSSVLYTTAVDHATAKGRRWDATEQVPWSAYEWQYCTTCPTTWRQLYYDDVESLGAKYDLVNVSNLRGAGIWALGYDGARPELYALLKAKFVDVGVAGLHLGAENTPTATGDSAYSPASGETAVFSPNGDGARDALRISYRLDPAMDGLTLSIYRAADRGLVGALSLPGLAAGDRTYDWDGRLGGASLPDGTYLLQLVGVRGGMSYAAPAADMTDPKLSLGGATFTVDTAPPAITPMSVTQTWISPDGDGRQEIARLTAVASAGAVRWSISVGDAAGTLVRTFSGDGGVIDATWDGRDAAGALVADGTYLATASGADEAGNAVQTTVQIGVDVRDPQGTVTASPKALAPDATSNAFSPNGDGWQDTATIRWTLDEAAAGTISVRSPTATIWTARIPSSVAGSVAWNGRDRSGRAVAEGTYTVVATVADAAGNPVAMTAEVRVDRTVGFLRASPGVFFPNDGDALARTTSVSFRSSRPTSTTLRVTDASGQVVRTAWQARARDAGTTTWTWDGRDDARAPLPSGYYRLELIASAGGVQQVIVRGLTLDAFLIAPSSRVVAAGQRLTVIVTSAEPLRSPPTVTLAQAGLAARSAAAVKRSDGRFQAVFTVAPGGSGPATVTVAGIDTGGHRNLSQTTVTVQ